MEVVKQNNVTPTPDGIDINKAMRFLNANTYVKEGLHQPYKYCTNEIKTAKFNVFTFLPLALLYQFDSYFNCFFLVTAIVTAIPTISPMDPGTAIGPFMFVLAVSLIREAIEDIKKHQYDKQYNTSVTSKYHSQKGKGFIEQKWSEIKVGDIIKINKNEIIPCDVLILKSGAANGFCHLETVNLDGESTLKTREAIKIAHSSIHDPGDLDEVMSNARCEVDKPNNNIYKVNGTLFLENYEKIYFTISNILLRGGKLMNAKYVYGLVIYTGKDTKLMMNINNSSRKNSLIDTKLNIIVIYILIIVLILCIICTVLGSFFREENLPNYDLHLLKADYVLYYNPDSVEKRNDVLEIVRIFASLFIIFNTLIPISIIITITIVKSIQTVLLEGDQELALKPDEKVKALSMKIQEDLGTIKYIFTDKTGTLTQNELEFKACSIFTRIFDEEAEDNKEVDDKLTNLNTITTLNPPDGKNNAAISSKVSKNFDKSLLINSLKNDIPFDIPDLTQCPFRSSREAAAEFLIGMAVNHDVFVEREDEDSQKKPEDEKLVYQGSNPDEVTLVSAAEEFGFRFFNRAGDFIELQVSTGITEEDEYNLNNKYKIEKFQVLQKFDFTSDRARSSIIVKNEKNEIKIYIKGSDTKIIPPLNTFSKRYLLEKSKMHLDSFARKGLRTLCYSFKQIPEEEYEAWAPIYKELYYKYQSDNTLNDSVDKLIEEIEKDATLLGITALEDKLQDEVKNDLQQLIEAGINVWMITGDKMDTAESIGHSCKLFNEDTEVFKIKDMTEENAIERMKEILESMKTIEKEMEHIKINGGDQHIQIGNKDGIEHNGDARPSCSNPSTLLSKNGNMKRHTNTTKENSGENKNTKIYSSTNFPYPKQDEPPIDIGLMIPGNEKEKPVDQKDNLKIIRFNDLTELHDYIGGNKDKSPEVINQTTKEEAVAYNIMSEGDTIVNKSLHLLYRFPARSLTENPTPEDIKSFHEKTSHDDILIKESRTSSRLGDPLIPKKMIRSRNGSLVNRNRALSFQVSRPQPRRVSSGGKLKNLEGTPLNNSKSKEEEINDISILKFMIHEDYLNNSNEQFNNMTFVRGLVKKNGTTDNLLDNNIDNKCTNTNPEIIPGLGNDEKLAKVQIANSSDTGRLPEGTAMPLMIPQPALYQREEQSKFSNIQHNKIKTERKALMTSPDVERNVKSGKHTISTKKKKDMHVNIQEAKDQAETIKDIPATTRQRRTEINNPNPVPPKHKLSTPNLPLDSKKFEDQFKYYKNQIQVIDKRRKSFLPEIKPIITDQEKNEQDQENPALVLVNFGIMIERSSITHCINNKTIAGDLFWNIVKKAQSIICCRSSPLQKAQVVEYVKKKSGEVSLAIGDGGNDVNMIRTANVGVGIFGKEGSQAAYNADYGISQFKYLKTLIFKHGRYSLERNSYFVYFFFFKNVLFTLPQFWLCFFSGFSGVDYYDEWYYLGYNSFITTFPVAVRALIEEDVDINFQGYPQRREILKYLIPDIFREYRSTIPFNIPKFFVVFFSALVFSLGMYFFPFFAFKYLYYDSTGKTFSYWDNSLCTFISVVVIHFLILIEDTHLYVWFNTTVYLLQIFIDIIFIVIHELRNSGEMSGITWDILSDTIFWLTLIITIAVCACPFYIVRRVELFFNDNIISNLRQKKQYEQYYIKKYYMKKLEQMTRTTRSLAKFKRLYNAENKEIDNFADKNMKKMVEQYKLEKKKNKETSSTKKGLMPIFEMVPPLKRSSSHENLGVNRANALTGFRYKNKSVFRLDNFENNKFKSCLPVSRREAADDSHQNY